MVPWAHPSLHPKQHVNWFSCYCTAHRRVFHCSTTFYPQNCPFPLGDWVLHLTMVATAYPSHRPKWHLNQFSRFCMGHKCYAVQCIVNVEENHPKLPLPFGISLPCREGLSHSHRQLGNMHRKIGKDRVCGSGNSLADREITLHTDRQTDMFITILRYRSCGQITAITVTATVTTTTIS